MTPQAALLLGLEMPLLVGCESAFATISPSRQCKEGRIAIIVNCAAWAFLTGCGKDHIRYYKPLKEQLQSSFESCDCTEFAPKTDDTYDRSQLSLKVFGFHFFCMFEFWELWAPHSSPESCAPGQGCILLLVLWLLMNGNEDCKHTSRILVSL